MLHFKELLMLLYTSLWTWQLHIKGLKELATVSAVGLGASTIKMHLNLKEYAGEKDVM